MGNGCSGTKEDAVVPSRMMVVVTEETSTASPGPETPHLRTPIARPHTLPQATDWDGVPFHELSIFAPRPPTDLIGRCLTGGFTCEGIALPSSSERREILAKECRGQNTAGRGFLWPHLIRPSKEPQALLPFVPLEAMATGVASPEIDGRAAALFTKVAEFARNGQPYSVYPLTVSAVALLAPWDAQLASVMLLIQVLAADWVTLIKDPAGFTRQAAAGPAAELLTGLDEGTQRGVLTRELAGSIIYCTRVGKTLLR